jgi:hypothetical protein
MSIVPGFDSVCFEQESNAWSHDKIQQVYRTECDT